MRNDVVNMSRARDKEKIWVPDRNWTYQYDFPYQQSTILSQYLGSGSRVAGLGSP